MDGYEYAALSDALAWQARYAMFEPLMRARLYRDIFVPPPAAGVDWSITVPPAGPWEIISVRATFTASAVVATRVPKLVTHTTDGVELQRFGAAVSIAASGSQTLMWVAGLGSTTTATAPESQLGIPAPLALENTSWGTFTTALDAGDQWSQIAVRIIDLSVGQIYQAASSVARDLCSEIPTPLTADDAIPATLPGQPAPPAAAQ